MGNELVNLWNLYSSTFILPWRTTQNPNADSPSPAGDQYVDTAEWSEGLENPAQAALPVNVISLNVEEGGIGMEELNLLENALLITMQYAPPSAEQNYVQLSNIIEYDKGESRLLLNQSSSASLQNLMSGGLSNLGHSSYLSGIVQQAINIIQNKQASLTEFAISFRRPGQYQNRMDKLFQREQFDPIYLAREINALETTGVYRNRTLSLMGASSETRYIVIPIHVARGGVRMIPLLKNLLAEEAERGGQKIHPILVGVSSEHRSIILAELEQAGYLEGEFTILDSNYSSASTVWLRDPVLSAHTSDGQTVLIEPKGQYRANQDLAQNLDVHFADTVHSMEAEVAFEGGDIIPTEDKIFIGPTSINVNAQYHLSVTSSKEEVHYAQLLSMGQLINYFSKQFNKSHNNIQFLGADSSGKTVGEILNSMSPNQQETLKAVCPTLFEASFQAQAWPFEDSLFQDGSDVFNNPSMGTLAFHIDEAVKFVPGTNRVLMSRPINPGLESKYLLERAKLESLGCQVFELPYAPDYSNPTGQSITHPTGQKMVLVYTNALEFRKPDGHRVLYLPIYQDRPAWSDNSKDPNITAYNETVIAAYETAYAGTNTEIIPIEGANEVASGSGVLRCLTLPIR